MPAGLPPPSDSFSAAEARRIALAAQGFGRRRTAGRSSWPAVSGAIDGMCLLQIDSVNVIARSHYFPVFSRIGDYDRSALDRRAFSALRYRAFFEYWAHEASLLPLGLHPLLRWRMEGAKRLVRMNKGFAEWVRGARGYIRAVKRELAERGPVAAADLHDPGERSGPWWGWHKGKAALEYLFHTGEVTTAARRGAFERVYDLSERVIPPDILALPTPSESDAIRALAFAGARAFGIATEFDIRDYFRLPPQEARRAVAELVEAGNLVPVQVEGWTKQAYLAAGAAIPRRVSATALMTPFDPLVWFRPRTERLFDFHYRIEIYTPAAKRRFGYYVLPFLMGERIPARVDLKADRAAGALDVRGAHAEPGVIAERIAGPLTDELRRLSGWLGLGEVRVTGRGELAAPIAERLRKRA